MSDRILEKCAVAVVGCGTVGGAVCRLLLNDRSFLRTRTGVDLDLRYVVDKNHENAKRLGVPESLLRTELDDVLADPEVSVMVELVGGTTVARELTERMLRSGKHVVTANKALLAHHGTELFSLARRNGASMAFEASCAGGIPIIRAIYDGLIANRIDAIYGIVNGTCNYILTEMIERGIGYDEALADAQRAGLAEANPTLDVAGVDSAHKITILASLAFGKRFELGDIPVEGIDRLELQDVEQGMNLGYVLKLLAIAQRIGDGYCLRVRPVFISQDHPLSWVSGPFNAVSVYGHATGHTMYYGRGAGGSPTASAVVADIVSIATGAAGITFNYPGLWSDEAEPGKLVPTGEIVSRYYMRLTVEDRPGALARIASILGDHGISIASVLQQEPLDDEQDEGAEANGSIGGGAPASRSPGRSAPSGPSVVRRVPVIITVYPARERDLLSAISTIDSLEMVSGPSSVISIIDEHPETFLH